MTRSALVFSLAAPILLVRLEPALVTALPPGSPLKKSLDEVLVGITGSQEWRQIEDGDFGRQQ